MNTRRKIVFCIVAPVLAIAGGVYLQQKYEPILAAPEITHDVVANERQTLRAVFKPPLARDALASLVNLPRWLIAPFEPREIAVLIQPDLEGQVLLLQVFINEKRLGPLIADYLNGPVKNARFVTWDSPGLVREERGFMRLQGTIPLKPETAPLMRPAPGLAGSPIPLDGSHMFEAVLCNQGNGALAAFLSLYAHLDKQPPAFDAEAVADRLSAVKEVKLAANFDPDGALEARLTIEGIPGSETLMGDLAFLIEVAAAEAAKELRRAYKIGLTCGIERERHIVTVIFTFKGIVQFLRGGSADA